MAVVNGQIANQTTFNNAFLSRTSPTTSTVAQVALENDEVESGAHVENVQRAINKSFEGVGATGEDDATINDYANQNYISNGDNRKVAIEKLDAQLFQTQTDLDTAEADIDATENRLTDIESNTSSFSGDKTFTDNVVVQGDLEVNGTQTIINTTELEVSDAYITINKGGTNGSAEGSGIEVERPAGNAAFVFDSSLAGKWKLGLVGSLYEVLVSGVSQVVSGFKSFVDGIATDTVAEYTIGAGVTIDGVLIKDGEVDGEDVSDLGSRLTTAENDIDATENRLTDIESNPSTFGGDKTFSDDVEVQGDSLFKTTRTTEAVYLSAVVNTQTGADQQLTDITAPIVKLTGAGLASVDRIDAPASFNKEIILINQTGADVIFKDNVGSPTSARIRTGTGADVQLANNQAVKLIYDVTTQLWYLHSVGGAASSGGSSSTFDMKLNSNYGGLSATNGIDGFWVAPANCQITNVFMYNEVAGSSGTTELDLKVKPFLSGAFTSVFLTTPKITSAAGANAWVGQGDTVTGCTAPVFTTLPFAVAAKSAIRMDLITAQTGTPQGCGLVVVYELI